MKHSTLIAFFSSLSLAFDQKYDYYNLTFGKSSNYHLSMKAFVD